MPYVHPVLGVECQTLGEYWQSEAKREGREAADLMDDFYSEIAKEEENSRKQIMSDFPGCLKMLQDYYSPEYGDNDFYPLEVLEITDANVRISMRSNSTKIICKVKCSDDKDRWLEYSETQYSGSYMEPPDFDCNCRELLSNEYKVQE